MVFFDGAFDRVFSEEYGKFLEETKDFAVDKINSADFLTPTSIA